MTLRNVAFSKNQLRREREEYDKEKKNQLLQDSRFMQMFGKFLAPAEELEALLYKKLQASENRELTRNEIMDIYDSKPEYGLAKVHGAAIHLIRTRHDVAQVFDPDNSQVKLRLVVKE